MNLSYSLIVEPLVLDPERRQEIDSKLDWPEHADLKIAERDVAQQDSSARMTAGALGVGNVDKMLAAAWQERQRAIAELEARKQTAQPDARSVAVSTE